MEHENAVKEALNALYHHPDDTVRVQADRWLQNFQGTLDAWQASFAFSISIWIVLGSIDSSFLAFARVLISRFLADLDYI